MSGNGDGGTTERLFLLFVKTISADVMKRKSQNRVRQYQRELNEVVYTYSVSENSDAELLRELYQGCVRVYSVQRLCLIYISDAIHLPALLAKKISNDPQFFARFR